ncbi:MAG: PHP domain-containing protein, partial [Geminicoccaceae bacterium]
MSHAPFVHLRVRSCHSLLESTVRLPELLARCQLERMPAVAIADRANLFGALEFSESAAKAGIQPIVGCLLPIAHYEPARGNGRPAAPSLLPVLVQNHDGYRNLLRLLSLAYLGGEVGTAPELQLDDLGAHGAGLIALTGGIEGPVGRALAGGNRGLAEGLLERLADTFPDRLYVELMRHDLEVEGQLEPALIDLALARDLPLVATNDVHFLDAAEWEPHDVLLCIAEGAQVGQAERRRVTPEHRFKSAKEMAELFADLPEALANTLVVAQRCAFRVPTQAPILPAYPTGDGQSEVGELRARAAAGLEAR